MHALPELSAEQAQINSDLMQLLAARIQQHGPISFSEYMHRCLYEPELGYYVNGLSKIGASGDFMTAPELSGDFASGIACQCAEVLALCGGSILEFGGGTGRLAVDVLLALDRADALPEQYLLLDVSGDLQQTQQQLIDVELPARLSDRVHWVSNFVDNFNGVVLANELFDAFPVEQFIIRDGVADLRSVDWTGSEFSYVSAVDNNLAAYIATIEKKLPQKMPENMISEFCPVLQPWWQSLADSLDTGVVLVCDYGCDRAGYYTAARSSGSLRCFFRHGVHDNALIYQGVQDITADVDFTALAEAATGCGFALEGYTTLARFMVSLDVLDQHLEATDQHNDLERFKATGKLKQLLLPEEMGERFMVAGFSKNIGPALRGFCDGDLSRLL